MKSDTTTVASCLPHLRFFARVMCANADQADKVVAECLILARQRFTAASPMGLLPQLLAELATLIRQQELTKVSVGTSAQKGTMGELQKLPPYHRDVLLTVELFNLRYWEAAVICDCPIGTIKSRLSRARTALAAVEPRPTSLVRDQSSRSRSHPDVKPPLH
ncbi:sigma factor-like helix-turn-helix DNA-binding protein [Rhizobium subbaraonis]|jgi:RNA polymerase sigma-70 factor (ECF subfamily)|uniref:sigma factor-like helix-turn-helix DNA-binding protein n=1 Tax=Rhizobium subbaraonis TaxID=908946 RepID=UPI000BE31538